MPQPSHYDSARAESSEHGSRRSRRDVDWVEYFGGKPPAEIITIHDDDSPAPPTTTQRLQQQHHRLPMARTRPLRNMSTSDDA